MPPQDTEFDLTPQIDNAQAKALREALDRKQQLEQAAGAVLTKIAPTLRRLLLGRPIATDEVNELFEELFGEGEDAGCSEADGLTVSQIVDGIRENNQAAFRALCRR